MAHAVIVRSAHAHARLARVDLGPALAHPGVLGGVTGVDVGDVSTLANPEVVDKIREQVQSAKKERGEDLQELSKEQQEEIKSFGEQSE